jgi:hypothetical protein
MTPIERAARALYEAGVDFRSPTDTLGDPLAWDELTANSKVPYFVGARAVLQAIREPSGEMLGDVHDTLLHAVKGEELDTAREVWGCMIEVALEEGPTSGA